MNLGQRKMVGSCIKPSTIQADDVGPSLDFTRVAGTRFVRKKIMFRSFFRDSFSITIALAAFYLAGCEDTQQTVPYLGGTYGTAPTMGGPPPDSVSYWDGDNLGGEPAVKIRPSGQRASVYKNRMPVVTLRLF